MKLSLVLLTTSLACLGSAAPIRDTNEIEANVLDQAAEGANVQTKRDQNLPSLPPLYSKMRREQASSTHVDRDSNAVTTQNLREDDVDTYDVQNLSRDLLQETEDESSQVHQTLGKKASVMGRRAFANADHTANTLVADSLDNQDTGTVEDVSEPSSKESSPFFKGDWTLTSRNRDSKAEQSNKRNTDSQSTKDNQDQMNHSDQMSHEEYLKTLAEMGLQPRVDQQVGSQGQESARTGQEQQTSQTSNEDSFSQVTRRGQAMADQDNQVEGSNQVDQTDSSNGRDQADTSNQVDQAKQADRHGLVDNQQR